jgi:hypothetical protein
MIAMKVADKDMVYLAKPDTAFPELHLGSFPTIY